MVEPRVFVILRLLAFVLISLDLAAVVLLSLPLHALPFPLFRVLAVLLLLFPSFLDNQHLLFLTQIVVVAVLA